MKTRKEAKRRKIEEKKKTDFIRKRVVQISVVIVEVIDRN